MCFRLNLTAEIAADRIIVNGEEFPLGHFAVEYLNQLGENGVAWQMQRLFPQDEELYTRLRNCELNENEFVELRNRGLRFLELLSQFQPYSLYDLSETRSEVERLFTAEQYSLIADWYRQLPKSEKLRLRETALIDLTELTSDLPYQPGLDSYEQAVTAANFVYNLLMDFDEVELQLQHVTDYVTDQERADQDYLAILAMLYCYNNTAFVNTRYKVRHQEDFTYIFVRELTFSDYLSFLRADFFEGMQWNHYPRRCPVCGRVFLMEKAYRQKYCKGNAPLELTGGRVFTCADWALRSESGFQKEYAEASDVKRMYKSSTGSIRKYQSDGKITHEQAEAAKRLANEKRAEAIRDKAYANGAYRSEIHFLNLLGEAANGADH